MLQIGGNAIFIRACLREFASDSQLTRSLQKPFRALHLRFSGDKLIESAVFFLPVSETVVRAVRAFIRDVKIAVRFDMNHRIRKRQRLGKTEPSRRPVIRILGGQDFFSRA